MASVGEPLVQTEEFGLLNPRYEKPEPLNSKTKPYCFYWNASIRSSHNDSLIRFSQYAVVTYRGKKKFRKIARASVRVSLCLLGKLLSKYRF